MSASETGTIEKLQKLWGDGWIPDGLYRPTVADPLNPRAAIARASAIEDVQLRGAPTRAFIELGVAVTDAEFLSAARFTGAMSMLIMFGVLIFYLAATFHGTTRFSRSPDAEVLAATLTLFSVIQAGRIRFPDKSNLRGLLSRSGTFLIVLSVLPATFLAVAIAFHVSRWAPVTWAGGAIAVEGTLVWLMSRGPLSDAGTHRNRPQRLLCTSPRPDYGQSEVLHTDWWRSTTAEALMIGTPAHAYVVWQNTGSPGLSQLLGAGTASPSVVGGNGRSPTRNADVLALLRSGTAKTALTFIMFRELPALKWRNTVAARPVRTDPQRLAPLETCTDMIDVIVGLAPDGRAPLLSDHPLKRVLAVAAKHRLIVLDAQNPVPTPSALHADWRWSRVRVGLRDPDISGLGKFLDAIRVLAADNEAWDLRVQMTPGQSARSVNPVGHVTDERGAGRLVLDSDLDPVTKAAGVRHKHRESRWRFMAICADARVGIENELVAKLAVIEPNLRLAGVNSAILHGMAIVLLLACQDRRHKFITKEDLLPCFNDVRANVSIPLDAWVKCAELGHANHYPLMRIRLRNQNRPGIMSSLLDYLGGQIREEFRLVRPGININTWHAQSEITAGYAAFTRMSAPLPVLNGAASESAEEMANKLALQLKRMEWEVRNWVGAGLPADVDRSPDGAHFTDEPVITINFIKVPTEP
ncbi:MAG TPA: hypothetical protein VGM14_23820 [Streptosporangiaceae bacterium]